MPQVKNIEKRIFDIENFEVTIRSSDGKDLRSDFVLQKQYEAERMMRNSCSVSQWKIKFSQQFPGLQVDVLSGDGTKARGNMKLSTVRDSYNSEEASNI